MSSNDAVFNNSLLKDTRPSKTPKPVVSSHNFQPDRGIILHNPGTAFSV
jgi:hypothetical protein